jgi:hypothetical protein
MLKRLYQAFGQANTSNREMLVQYECHIYILGLAVNAVFIPSIHK